MLLSNYHPISPEMKKHFFTLIAFFVMFINLASAQVNYTFKSFSTNYTALTNATRLSLSSPTPNGYFEEDEGFVNQLPIGFNFVFDNKTYSTINLNVNGFASFGTPFTIDVHEKYNKNSLARGPIQQAIGPIIAPLWDDLWIVDTFSLKYKVDGVAPNRTFSVEWSNVQWNYNNYSDTAISFQMVLFETSNRIQFLYKPLNGRISNASASIGIATCSNCINSFLSVPSFSENTSISGIKEFNEINSKPTGSIGFEFIPGKLSMPEALTIDSYNSNKLTFSWNSISSGNYDYAISKSELQPEIFNTTTSKTVSVDNLDPATQYYIHVRTNNSIFERSGWLTIPFKTAFIATLPYKENFEKTDLYKVPNNQTAINPNGGNAWSTISTTTIQPYNKAIAVKSASNFTTDAWLSLPAIKFEGGLSYRLKFSFKTDDTSKGVQKIEVRIGKLLSSGMMGWQVLYKNVKVNQLNFRDTSFLFAAPANEEYFIAFRSISDVNTAAIIIDDIEIDKIKPLPVKIVYFKGERKDGDNLLQWRTSAELRNKTYELQRSADNKNFVTIQTLESKAVNGISNSVLDYSLTDTKPNTVDYYRLKIIDIDGGDFYTQTIKIMGKLDPKIVLNRMYPNPATDIVTSIIYAPYNTKMSYQIFDSYGKMILNIPVTLNIGDNLVKADISKLNRGVYYAKLVTAIGSGVEPKMFIKQ